MSDDTALARMAMEVDSLRSRNEELEAALRPFADFAASSQYGDPKGEGIFKDTLDEAVVFRPSPECKAIHMKHFREAHRTLASPPDSDPETPGQYPDDWPPDSEEAGIDYPYPGEFDAETAMPDSEPAEGDALEAAELLHQRLLDGRDVPMPKNKEHAEALATIGLRWLEDNGYREPAEGACDEN